MYDLKHIFLTAMKLTIHSLFLSIAISLFISCNHKGKAQISEPDRKTDLEYKKHILYKSIQHNGLIKEDTLLNLIIPTDSGLIFKSAVAKDSICGYFSFQDIEKITLYAPTNTNNNLKKILKTNNYKNQNHFIPNNIEDSLPLSGKKIALDPGHIAGNMAEAKIEGKFIEIRNKNTNYSFYESDLTLKTVQLVKDSLEIKGAKVFITRPLPGICSFGYTYNTWLKEKFRSAADSALKVDMIDKKTYNKLLSRYKNLTTSSKKFIFHYLFKHIDNLNRANLMNQFKADINIIVHYNVDDNNKYWTKPTQKNYCMTFVGGGFLAGELERKDQQIEFIRLAFSKDLKNSLNLSRLVTEEFVEGLAIQAASENDAGYLTKYSVAHEHKGVFSRNLSLTRNVHGVVCYGESLYQDNINELKQLNSIDKNAIPKRVTQVANAYCKAILKYFQNIEK